MDHRDHINSTEVRDTEKIGETLGIEIAAGSGPRVVLLSGDLGSGKSVFVRGMARGLGIKSRILSPTFVLLRRYPCPSYPTFTLYHYDLYRISGNTDAVTKEIAEIMEDPHAIVAVEWAERLDVIRVPHYFISITGIDENNRTIHIEKRNV